MRALSALQAATEFGGWQPSGADTPADVAAYFTPANFRAMFPGEDPTTCGGYTLAECAAAVLADMNRAGAA